MLTGLSDLNSSSAVELFATCLSTSSILRGVDPYLVSGTGWMLKALGYTTTTGLLAPSTAFCFLF